MRFTRHAPAIFSIAKREVLKVFKKKQMSWSLTIWIRKFHIFFSFMCPPNINLPYGVNIYADALDAAIGLSRSRIK